MVHYKKGDLFLAPEDILAHGVNCRGAFGSGVAGRMAREHNRARDRYLHKHLFAGWKLGDVQFVASNDKFIANCATQDDFGYKGECLVDYKAIKECMYKVKDFAMENQLSIAIPKIGAGLAGGDWKIIESILEEVFDYCDVTVYEL